MSIAWVHNSGAFVTPLACGGSHMTADAAVSAVACGAATAVAAGAGDATEVVGVSIDRTGYSTAKLVIAYKTTLTALKTLSFAVAYEDSEDGLSWNTPVAVQESTLAKTGAVTDAVDEVVLDVNLTGLEQYVRFNVTPELSHTSTDTAVFSLSAVLGVHAVAEPASVTGATIDRKGYGSGKLAITYSANLSETRTVSFAVAYQESADGDNWDTAVVLQAATVAATGDGGPMLGVLEFDQDFAGRKRFQRFNVTPSLSLLGDSVSFAAVFLLGGGPL